MFDQELQECIFVALSRVFKYGNAVPLGLPFVIIEIDQRRVEQIKTAGMPVGYGDSSHEIVLEAAGVGFAYHTTSTDTD